MSLNDKKLSIENKRSDSALFITSTIARILNTIRLYVGPIVNAANQEVMEAYIRPTGSN